MIKLRVTLLGKSYNVEVEELDMGNAPKPRAVPTARAPLETAALSMGPAPRVLAAATKIPGTNADDACLVFSPLPGKIVSVDVKVGDAVTEGAQVATIEAMKMNTYVFAPKTGKVVSINAHSGDAVEEGAVLLRLED